MEKLKIPKKGIGISKTFRLPQYTVEKMEALSKLKNNTLNQTVIYLINFALENLDSEDQEKIQYEKKRDVS